MYILINNNNRCVYVHLYSIGKDKIEETPEKVYLTGYKGHATILKIYNLMIP